MKIEMDDEATSSVIICIMIVVFLLFVLRACEGERKHMRWVQEHSITNR